MPFNGDPLEASEVALIRAWIETGAGEPARSTTIASGVLESAHHRIPPSIRPTTASSARGLSSSPRGEPA